MADSDVQTSQHGYQPVTEGYQPGQQQPLSKGFQPFGSGAIPARPPPTPPSGGSNAAKPAQK